MLEKALGAMSVIITHRDLGERTNEHKSKP